MSYEEIINSDPTLKRILREYVFSYKNIDDHIKIYVAAAKLALFRYINQKY